MIKRLFILILLCLPLLAREDFDSGLYFRQAGDYYKNRQYIDAVRLYQKVINQGVTNSVLFYNYANTCFQIYRERQGEEGQEGYLGLAVLYYEKALRLAPGDEDIRHNLDFAAQYTVDKFDSEEEENPLMKGIFFFYYFMDWTTQRTLAAAALLILAVLLALFFTTRLSFRMLLLKAAVPFLVIYLVLVCSAWFKYRNVHPDNEAVIMQPGVEVKTEPVWEADTAFKLHEGTKIYIKKEIGGWYNIYLENGFNGWLEGYAFIRI